MYFIFESYKQKFLLGFYFDLNRWVTVFNTWIKSLIAWSQEPMNITTFFFLSLDPHPFLYHICLQLLLTLYISIHEAISCRPWQWYSFLVQSGLVRCEVHNHGDNSLHIHYIYSILMTNLMSGMDYLRCSPHWSYVCFQHLVPAMVLHVSLTIANPHVNFYCRWEKLAFILQLYYANVFLLP